MASNQNGFTFLFQWFHYCGDRQLQSDALVHVALLAAGRCNELSFESHLSKQNSSNITHNAQAAQPSCGHVTLREIKTCYSYLHLGDGLNISDTFAKLDEPSEFCSAEDAALLAGSRGKRMDALHQQGAALASIFTR